MRHLRDNRGFTLVELMITVAMVAVLVVVTLPPVIKALQQRQALNAAQAVLDVVEFAKVQAASRNLAYRVTWTAEGESTNGTVVVGEGPTSACITWDQGRPALRRVDLDKEFPSVRLTGIRPTAMAGGSLCIKPDGRVLDASTSLPVASGDATYSAGDAMLLLQRINDVGQHEGALHIVVIPFNGAARIIFEG